MPFGNQLNLVLQIFDENTHMAAVFLQPFIHLALEILGHLVQMPLVFLTLPGENLLQALFVEFHERGLYHHARIDLSS